jgi:hypothetical protein
MARMVDEIYDLQYQAARGQMNSTIRAAARHLGYAVANAFTVLNRIEYSAPWARPARKVQCN